MNKMFVFTVQGLCDSSRRGGESCARGKFAFVYLSTTSREEALVALF